MKHYTLTLGIAAASLAFFAAGCNQAAPQPTTQTETPPPAAVTEPTQAATDQNSAATDTNIDMDKELDALDKNVNSADPNDYNPKDLPTDYNSL